MYFMSFFSYIIFVNSAFLSDFLHDWDGSVDDINLAKIRTQVSQLPF